MHLSLSPSLPSTSHPSRPPSLLSGEFQEPPVSFLPHLTLFLYILHQWARLMVLKPNHIRLFSCLISKFSNCLTYSYVPQLPVSTATSYTLPVLCACHLPPIHHATMVLLPGLLSFFNSRAPSHARPVSVLFPLPRVHFLPLRFQRKSPVFKDTCLIHWIKEASLLFLIALTFSCFV